MSNFVSANPGNLPTSDELLRVLEELICRDTVQSVSCPLQDERVWSVLVREQVRRSTLAGRHPQAALALSGPDSGLSIPHQSWGGYIHIPYEGACGADLFINPAWRQIALEYDKPSLTLSDIVFHGSFVPQLGYACHYLVVQFDLGTLHAATRRAIDGGWFLYESKDPYVPNVRLNRIYKEREIQGQ